MRLNAILLAMGVTISLTACATSGNKRDEGAPPVIIRNGEEMQVDTGGLPPDKQADIYLVLNQRDASARKCYQDMLNEKKTRDFKGTVKILMTLNTEGQATSVRVTGGSLNNKEVEDCLVETVKEFEFPKMDRGGDIQYEYTFEPQY
jgi:TonB family protein